MNEAEILESTYYDSLTVFRKETYIDKNTRESKERETMVYDAIPCALSQSKNDVPLREDVKFEKSEEYVLFTNPAIRMEADDRAVILTQTGESYEGRTGRTLVYASSHGETKIQIEGIA